MPYSPDELCRYSPATVTLTSLRLGSAAHWRVAGLQM
uniref:Uncharacterized protein n=1 Tax=Arundo donax TaxID=35708 RepID=A0A0A8ZCG0_ARUDO